MVSRIVERLPGSNCSLCRIAPRAIAGLLVAGILVGWCTGSRAAEKPRMWSDVTGKFRVEATYQSVEDGKVVLKDKEGKTMRVELKRLSVKDREYVEQKNANDEKIGGDEAKATPSPTRENPTESAADSSTESASKTVRRPVIPIRAAGNIALKPTSEKWKFDVAPSPAGPKLRTQPVPLPRTRDSESIDGVVISSNGACAWAAYKYDKAFDKNGKETRLVLCSLATGRVGRAKPVAGHFVPEALDDSGQQALMRPNEWGNHRRDTLQLWQLNGSGLRTGSNWVPYENNEENARTVRWAAFVDSQHVVTTDERGVIVFWKLDGLRFERLSTLVLDSSGVPALSPDHRYLAFCTKTELGILDVESQQVVALQKIARFMAFPCLAFSPQGSRVACIAYDHLYVCDFATGAIYREFPCKDIAVLGRIDFPTEDHVLLADEELFDLATEARLWHYGGAKSADVGGGQCWFYVLQENETPAAFVPSRVPHAEVEKTLKKSVEDPEFYVLKAGTTVKLNVDGVQTEKELVRDDLTKRLEEMGFQVDDNGSIELKASTEQDKVEEISFNMHQYGHQSVQIQVYVSRLMFVYKGNIIWQSLGTNIPGGVSLQDGESLQDNIHQYEKPNNYYFHVTELPKMLMKTQQTTLGRSTVTAEGIRSATSN